MKLFFEQHTNHSIQNIISCIVCVPKGGKKVNRCLNLFLSSVIQYQHLVSITTLRRNTWFPHATKIRKRDSNCVLCICKAPGALFHGGFFILSIPLHYQIILGDPWSALSELKKKKKKRFMFWAYIRDKESFMKNVKKRFMFLINGN